MLPNGAIADQGLPDRIKEARLRMGLSREAFARALGYNPTTVALWERGAWVPSIVRLAQVARISGVTLNWLRKGVE